MNIRARQPDDDHAHRMMALFEGFAEAFGTYDGTVPNEMKGGKLEIKATATTRRSPVTRALWESHLEGINPLGIIPIRDDNTCLWGVIDVDIYDVSLSDLVDKLERASLPLIVWRSKSGGAHLFLFMAEPISADLIQSRLKEMASLLGYGSAEVFPKQRIVQWDRGDLGSWLNMPYYGGDDTDRFAVKKGGLAMSLAEFLHTAEARAITAGALPETAGPGEGDSQTRATRADADERLQHWCHRVVTAAPTDANNQLTAGAFDIARYCRDTDLDADHARHKIRSAWLVRKQGELTAESEFDDVWRRQFAAGWEKGSPALRCLAGLPPFERVWIEKDEDEVIWRIQIDGWLVVVEVRDLMDQRRFNEHAMRQMGRAFHIVKDRNRWIDHVNRAARNAEYVELDRGTTAAEEFRDLLEEFLMNRHRGQMRDDILLGRPWEDEDKGLHFFRIKDLQAHLMTGRLANRFATEPARRVGKRIRELGGEPAEMTIRDKRVSLFCVPANLFQPMPKADIPPISKGPV